MNAQKKKCFNCTQVLDFANQRDAGPNNTVTCPSCGAVNPAGDVAASALAGINVRGDIAARALAALPDLPADGSLPADIQLFPPGKDVPFTLQDYPDKDFKADVDASTAALLDGELQTMIARASAGKAARPFGDKNHEDAEATFHPTKIFWGGDDPKAGGVRVKTEWTGFGGALVKARAFCYASGNFRFNHTTQKIVGLLGENIAGLVNRPGFSTIQAFAKASQPAADSSNNNNQQNKMTDKEISDAISAGITAGLTPVVKRIETLEASAKAASPVKDDPTIAAFETRLKNLETEKDTNISASAKAAVAGAVKLGKIASQDTAGIAWWENQIAAEAKAGKSEATVRLEKLPVNPAFLQVIAAQAAGGTANTAEPTAEGFAACVQAHAKAGKKKGEAIDLAMAENIAGYKAWRDANGKPGL